jgi:hypothetical protein
MFRRNPILHRIIIIITIQTFTIVTLTLAHPI